MTDLISRQAVNDALDRTCNLVCQYSKKQRYSMCGACPLGSAFDAIAELPSAEKHGKWNNDATCSVCGEGFLCDTDYFNYCPNCGAQMEERRNGEQEDSTLDPKIEH